VSATLRALLDVAKLLLSEAEPDCVAELILGRLMTTTQADRGFIVVREGKSYEEKFHVHFDSGALSGEERRFSRSLVRKTIASGALLHSHNVLEDPRFAGTESLERAGPHAVLVVPLEHGGEISGVVYLERLATSGGFSEDAVEFASGLAELAALSLLRAAERETLRRRTRSLERDLLARYDFHGIVTRNAGMLRLLQMVAQVATSDAAVLIGGETGTGKELVAQALHVNSRRAARPFVTLHCTALPTTILESELFGHTRGAFTGADRERAGRIASASGGTLFLDEVADIAPEVQPKLLRFLQFGELQRVGSDRVEKVDVRVIAATHRNLPELIRTGKFREDLYYRLKVVELTVPPLRERADDIPVLVGTFLEEERERTGEQRRMSDMAMAALESHLYPGNVRELRHAVERASVLATGPLIDLDVLPPDIVLPFMSAGAEATAEPSGPSEESGEPSSGLERARRAASDAAERAFIAALLERTQGNVSLASRSAGIHRSYLQRLIAKHDLKRK
jgi:transcriptional regulator with GAF, ATPase, and Fis domain